jgi:hypothetical protein
VLFGEEHELLRSELRGGTGLASVPWTVLEDAGVSHTLEGLECLLEEKPEYANERDPEVLIDAVAVSPDMFFVLTYGEMIEAMKTKGLEPDTTALPAPQRNMRSASKKNTSPPRSRSLCVESRGLHETIAV